MGLSCKFKLRPRVEVKPADTVVPKVWYCGTVPLLWNVFAIILFGRACVFMNVYKLLITLRVTKNPVTLWN